MAQNDIVNPLDEVWKGQSKIVIGIDIGTTQSGVAFTFLDNESDSNPVIHRVVQWPGQEARNQQSKVPSLVWYDSSKEAVRFGAEATSHRAQEDAEDNGWQLARHFKLQLHPKEMRVKHDLKLDALPPGISLRQIYRDFLGYLFKHTQGYFEDRMIDGKQIWNKYRSEMEFVLAHPNGWGIREQTFLRTAAVEAGFTNTTAASTKIRFVTEAEASVHFCIHRTNLGSRLQPGIKFAVCDAGGSTVDTTVYSVVDAHPSLKLQEARASACVQAGAIFVDAAAEKYIKNVLTNANLSQEDVDEYTVRGVKDFENSVKRTFTDADEDRAVEIAGPRVNNPAIRMRRGRMRLPADVIKSFFNVCLDAIVASVDQQIQGIPVSYILLVGGFGDSPLLRQEFKNRYEPQGCQVTLTNDSTSKAVAEGAIIWSICKNVSARAPRSSFGIETAVQFNSTSPGHLGRKTFPCASGIEKVSGRWSQIATKGVVLDADTCTRESFCQAFSSPHPELKNFEVVLLAHSEDNAPIWARDQRGELLEGFRESCTITADLANLGCVLEPRIGMHGVKYWRLYFDVCIRFGGTELEAYIEWEENGQTRTGTVTIVPDQPL